MTFFENNYNSVRYPIAPETSDGLRRAQVGAIHAIAAHFTYHTDPSTVKPAIIVMPTGSGKTAVLMLAAFVLRAERVLVISPSRLVCDQTAKEFQSLELLRKLSALENVLGTHTVCNLKHKLTSTADWASLQEFDVVVSTPNCISPAYEEIANPPPDFFDLVLFDEAHHAPAKTWKAIVSAFPHAKKVHFTATPFRSDRKEIEGTIVYEFSVREAYEDKIFGSIRFVPVAVKKQASEDVAIAQKAQEIFDTDRAGNFDHYLMVRTNTKRHARLLKKVYKDHTRLNLRMIHSGHSLTHIEQTIRELKAKNLAACRRGGSISSPQAEFDAQVDDKHAVINHFTVS